MRRRVFVCIVLPALLAAAGEERRKPPRPFPEARKDYEAAKNAGDAKRLAETLTVLARSGFLSDAKADQTYARNALKSHLKARNQSVRLAAVKGYGVLRIKRSSRDLRPLLRKRGLPKEVTLAVLESWALICDPGSHTDLLDMLRKPVPDKLKREIAAAAAEALRGYRVLPPRQRFEVLDDLVKTFIALHSASHKRPEEKSVEIKWWEAVAPHLVAAFNSLASQRHGDYYECIDWWRANRRRLKEGWR